jgi:hypothetical protein
MHYAVVVPLRVAGLTLHSSDNIKRWFVNILAPRLFAYNSRHLHERLFVFLC